MARIIRTYGKPPFVEVPTVMIRDFDADDPASFSILRHCDSKMRYFDTHDDAYTYALVATAMAEGRSRYNERLFSVAGQVSRRIEEWAGANPDWAEKVDRPIVY